MVGTAPMARSPRIPKYRRHSSGRARVTLNGRDHLLGPYGSAASRQAYERLRPILMTSFAFILGVFPLVVAHGAGAEMRRTLGTAVFAGMIGVTLFGVFLTPVFFFVIRRLTGSGRGVNEPARTAPPVSGDGKPSHPGDGRPEPSPATGAGEVRRTPIHEG